jgi:hypothetical protein
MWISVLKYAVKHALAAFTMICFTVALTVITYFVLLIWAMLVNAPLGSPVALPFWSLIALVLSTAAAVVVCWPVASICELVCRRLRNRHPLLQIFLATVFLFVEVVSLGAIYAVIWKQPIARSLVDSAMIGLILLIPLGVYWWSLQATDWILEKCCLFWQWIWKPTQSADTEGVPPCRSIPKAGA